MTPDKRLDQLEPLVADVLQKVDRLIEGQGRLVELVVEAKELATNANQLAVSTHELAVTTHELAISTNETVNDIKYEVEQVKRTGDITANGLANLTNSVQTGFTDLHQQMIDVKASQNLILQLLREKLP